MERRPHVYLTNFLLFPIILLRNTRALRSIIYLSVYILRNFFKKFSKINWTPEKQPKYLMKYFL